MGFDTLELVMKIEDEFSISIPDADAELIQTVGHLHAYVCHALRPHGDAVCPSARAFYRLRHILLDRHPIPRRFIRPSARLAHLLPEESRHCWPAIATAAGLDKHFTFDGKTPTRFPAAYTTLRDLVRRMTFPAPRRPRIRDAFEQDIWQKVQAIVSHQAGVRLEEIHPETHIIYDLNME